MQIDRDLFFQLQMMLETIPFNQTQEWLEHVYGQNMNRIHYFVDSTKKPHVACFGYLGKNKFIGLRLNIDGICKSADCSADDIRTFFKSIIDEGYDMVQVSDIDAYNPDFEVGVRRAGLIRPLGLHLCPMSMIVDLQKPFQFHRNWRRNVKKAAEHGCHFVAKESPTLADAKEFVRLFGELKERKGLGFTLSPDKIMTLLKGNYKLFFIVDANGINICGRISYINNTDVYDVYAANSYESISVGAAYMIQEYIFQFFKEKGYEKFDYGRIPPSAGKMDNIYVAKSYSGGSPIGYNGEWNYSIKLWKTFFFSFYQFYLHHGSLY